MLVDLPLDQLREFRHSRPIPSDFSAFWTETLEEARGHARAPVFAPHATALRSVRVYDVTFSGYAGDDIKAWLLVPRDSGDGVPCVIEYLGYGRGRGFPLEWLVWPSHGYACLVMDNRGQAAEGGHGETPDRAAGVGPEFPGFLTRGIGDRADYYYRRLYTDAVLAVEAALAAPAIDPGAIITAGGSQGGALALAAAALSGRSVGALVDVPFMCAISRAVEITDSKPYAEVREFLRHHREKVDRVLETLDYFDAVHLASLCRAPALFSVGLMDDVCPPSTVFAAYNAYQGPKDLRVWPYSGHEGGGVHQFFERLSFVAHATGRKSDNVTRQSDGA